MHKRLPLPYISHSEIEQPNLGFWQVKKEFLSIQKLLIDDEEEEEKWNRVIQCIKMT